MRCSLTSQGIANCTSNRIQPKISQVVADAHLMFSAGIQANHALFVTYCQLPAKRRQGW